MKRLNVIVVAGGLAALLTGFQNCTEVHFDEDSGSTLKSASVASYVTDEDVALTADLIRDRATLGALTNTPSQYSLTKKSSHGTLQFDVTNATFRYTPDPDFFGDDAFEIAEIPQGATSAIPRTVAILVRSVNDMPIIKTDFLSYDMNSRANPVILEIADKDDPTVIAAFSHDDSLKILRTANGLLERKNGQILYTPNVAFRGVEQVEFFAIDTRRGFSQKKISITVGNPFRDFQPALAIRGAGCIACHANVRSPFVTDAGFGSAWFAGINKPVTHTNPNLVLGFNGGNMYGDHADNWATAKIAGPVLVPKTTEAMMGGKLQTLASYYLGIESAKEVPAQVIEKSKVYIGAPTVAVLEERFNSDISILMRFYANEASSPLFSGIVDRTGYWSNSGPIVCDGDLFLRGTVYLDRPVIHTRNGCRIHATGPIFLQGSPEYVNLGDASSANNTNLQLVSARAIFAGVGLTHCESGTQFYAVNNTANPLKFRLQDLWTTNTHVSRLTQDPRREADFLLAEAAKLPGYIDASCYPGGRSVHLERLLLNAPNVQSRFTGNVSGVVIAESALFALNQFSYEFDPVFRRVPVLPLLAPEDFLVIE